MKDGQSLADRQAAFMAQVLSDTAAPPADWCDSQMAGMNVYRGNYRSAVIEAMKGTYEKTRQWVGDDAFQQAATHHVISNPAASWTIDDVGAGFDQTCAKLFQNNPEVAELAWLEWAMLSAFTAENVAALDVEQFSQQSATFGEEEWANLRLTFLPGASTRAVGSDLRGIWTALNQADFVKPDTELAERAAVLVWREDERSTFMMGPAEESAAFGAAKSGVRYGEICMILAGDAPSEEEAQEAAMRAGGYLGRWLNEGLITAINA